MGGMDKNLKHTILPGVKELLVKLDKDSDIYLGIVTGDISQIVHNVLEEIGILSHFNVVISGEHEIEREELVQSAIQLAETQTRKKFDKIVVIGDSTQDIDAGKAFKTITIGVLTGEHKEKDLKAHGADYVFKDLAEKGVYEAITR